MSSPPPASRKASRTRVRGAGRWPSPLPPASTGSVSIPATRRRVPGRAASHRIARPVQDVPRAAETAQPLALGRARARVTGEGVQPPVVIGDLEVAAGVLDGA